MCLKQILIPHLHNFFNTQYLNSFKVELNIGEPNHSRRHEIKNLVQHTKNVPKATGMTKLLSTSMTFLSRLRAQEALVMVDISFGIRIS